MRANAAAWLLLKPKLANPATFVNSSSACSGVRPLTVMQPVTNRAWSFSISLRERQVPMARRKPSESAAEKPATSMAIFITCSW